MLLASTVDAVTGKIKELVLMKTTMLQNFNYAFASIIKQVIHQTEMHLSRREIRLYISLKSYIENKLNFLKNYTGILKKHLTFTISNNLNIIDRANDKIVLLNPQKILRRGYSITMKNGKVLKDPEPLVEGDELKTILYKGKIISILKKKQI